MPAIDRMQVRPDSELEIGVPLSRSLRQRKYNYKHATAKSRKEAAPRDSHMPDTVVARDRSLRKSQSEQLVVRGARAHVTPPGQPSLRLALAPRDGGGLEPHRGAKEHQAVHVQVRTRA